MAMRAARPEGGFTLLELMVVLAVAALLFGLITPSITRLSEAMRYRDTVRQLIQSIREARQTAITEGRPVDLLINTDNQSYALAIQDVPVETSAFQVFPDELRVDVTYAVEVSPEDNVAAIRFYPGGGASGGDIDIVRPTGVGVRLSVDWLLADVDQNPMTTF